MPSYVELIDSVYDSIFNNKKALLSATRYSGYSVQPKYFKFINNLFFYRYPEAKVLSEEEVKELFRNFLASMLRKCEDPDMINNATHFNDYGILLRLLLSYFHGGHFTCDFCHMPFDKDHIVSDKSYDEVYKRCTFCQSHWYSSKCDICGCHFDVYDPGEYNGVKIVPKAYPVLTVAMSNDVNGKLNGKKLENLGTVVQLNDSEFRVYLSLEALDSPELAKLLNCGPRSLQKWKGIFGKNACNHCKPAVCSKKRGAMLLPLYSSDIYYDGVIDNLPYNLERADLIDEEILEKKKETVMMLERECANDDSALFYMIKANISHTKLTTKFIAKSIADTLLAIIAKDNKSENIVKEANYSRKGGEILVVVPVEEAKETEKSAVEEILNKIMAAISNSANIEHDFSFDTENGCITVTVSFRI